MSPQCLLIGLMDETMKGSAMNKSNCYALVYSQEDGYYDVKVVSKNKIDYESVIPIRRKFAKHLRNGKVYVPVLRENIVMEDNRVVALRGSVINRSKRTEKAA